jgi:Chaperone of endosialidase
MKRMIQLKDASLFVTAFLLATFACMSIAHAVVPAPDGGYPGQNTAEGQSALLHLTGGAYNTAVGWASLGFNVTGNFNTAIGAGALLANTADNNTAAGAGALLSNTTGNRNTANGAFALFSNTTGIDNTAIGVEALFSTTNGFNNIGIGQFGGGSVTGNNNIDIGDPGFADDDGVIRIGTGGTQTTTFIAGIFGVTTGQANAIPVLIDSGGQLGTMSSSRRFKKDIQPMDKASEAVLTLKPVAFHYKADKENTPQFGLIAEEVAKVNPALVVPDKEGKPYTVRYDAVNAMLLNEFLKEHRRVGELEARIAQQHKAFQAAIAHEREQMEAAVAQLNAQFQKVTAQLELDKRAAQTVLNNR